MPAPHKLINLNCIGSASQMHLQKQISVKVIFADFVWRRKSLNLSFDGGGGGGVDSVQLFKYFHIQN